MSTTRHARGSAAQRPVFRACGSSYIRRRETGAARRAGWPRAALAELRASAAADLVVADRRASAGASSDARRPRRDPPLRHGDLLLLSCWFLTGLPASGSGIETIN